MSTIDKIKAIAPWLVALCVIVFIAFKATDSWLKTIMVSLMYSFVWFVKVLIGNNKENNEGEDGADNY